MNKDTQVSAEVSQANEAQGSGANGEASQEEKKSQSMDTERQMISSLSPQADIQIPIHSALKESQCFVFDHVNQKYISTCIGKYQEERDASISKSL